MIKQKKTTYLILPILILALTALACSGGSSTTHKLSGNSGEVRVKMKEVDGTESTSMEISEDWTRTRVAATVTFSVEAGSCQENVTGEDGTVVSLSASAGSPGQASGDLVTDGFGEVDLTAECQGGTNLDLTVKFSLK